MSKLYKAEKGEISNGVNSRKIDLNLEGTEARITCHYFKDAKVKTFLVSFAIKRRILSTLEGFKKVKYVGNHYNPPQLWDFVHENKKEYEKRIYADLKIKPNEVAMLFTGADMDNISIKMEESQDLKICACVTAGVKSNSQRIGVDEAGSIEKEGKFKHLGTINIILLTNASLTDGAMARSIITITEAKTIAFQDLDIRSSYNPEFQATGTGTDNVIVVSGFGPVITYVGGHTKIGEIMARTVTSAVKEAILKQKGNLK
jgi:adenosylcobinamide amidohydrolase